MTITESVKRLEQAGTENARTTKKLRAAARVVAGKITEVVVTADSENVMLPRDYQVSDNGNNQDVLFKMRLSTDDEKWGAFYDEGQKVIEYSRSWTPEYSDVQRPHVLKFAADIADGLLDEIAEFLEKRSAENEAKAEVLEAAKI